MSKKTAFLAFLASSALVACAPTTVITRDTTPVVAAATTSPLPAVTATSVAVVEKPIAPPETKAEDLIELQAVAANHFALADKPSEIAVRVHLKAKPRVGGKRPSINLGLVVDTSGSMEGSAIEDARKASLALVDALSEGDRLAVVVFHSATEVLVPSTVLTKETIADIRTKIAGIKASGTTDLGGGLAAGLGEVRKAFQRDGINRVVLLGDGVPNDPSMLPSLSQSAAAQQISITTLGLGLDYDETLMSQLALNSGGKYHYLKDSSQVAKVFTDEVLRLKQVTGRATSVAIAPGPGVVVKEILGLPVQHIGNKSVVLLGDMSEGDERDVLVKLSVQGRHAGSLVELLDAEVGVDNPQKPGQRVSERAFVSLKSTADTGEIDKSRDHAVELSVARMSVANAIVRAIALARMGDLANGKKILDAAEKEAKALAKELDDKELAEKVKSLAGVRKTLASLVPPPAPVATFRPASFGAPKTAEAPAPRMPMPAPMMKTQADAMGTIQGL